MSFCLEFDHSPRNIPLQKKSRIFPGCTLILVLLISFNTSVFLSTVLFIVSLNFFIPSACLMNVSFMSLKPFSIFESLVPSAMDLERGSDTN
eukprot:TRINITY_DN36175_c0_g1_i1.p1 TRINITY_DN36175_c0_g1~~TRINITY_DN36175_c0_g1_i1.p1  ORF type:complete len:104 (+),score=9.71 TRINITY_DN36175_c0_g1_i1:38-313(+)